jgi:hypothetical protein
MTTRKYKVPFVSEVYYGREDAEQVGWDAAYWIHREVTTIS